MTNKIALSNQKIMVLSNGSEIWANDKKLDQIGHDLVNGGLAKNTFIQVEGRYVNTSFIVEICIPEDLEEKHLKKEGAYKCRYGTLHMKGDPCNCSNPYRYVNEKLGINKEFNTKEEMDEYINLYGRVK